MKKLEWVKDKAKGIGGTYMYQMHQFNFSHNVYFYNGGQLIWAKNGLNTKDEALRAAEMHHKEQQSQ